MKTVGFLTNLLTLRGTEIVLYDYAHYNELLLNNKSVILARFPDSSIIDCHLDAYKKFNDRFIVEYYKTQKNIDEIVEKHNISHLYVIKLGLKDNNISTKCRNLIHCVGTTSEPHGEVYSTLDEINRMSRTNFPVVPHIVRVNDTLDNMREELKIPDNAVVFGRYGGLNEFNISFVYDCIKEILNTKKDIYFLFMNTKVFYTHQNIIYIDGTASMYKKRKFINTCDAMLYAREDGESFGLSCGEFAICLKPVIIYGKNRCKSHINILGDQAVLYNNYKDLYSILNTFQVGKYNMSNNGYLKYGVEDVMKIFNDIYLSV